MAEWKEVILQDIISVLGDGLHGTPQYDDDGEYYFINGNNLSEGKIVIKESTKKASKVEYEKYKKDLNDRTIFVSINGTLGNVALYNNEKCILGKSACYFNILKEVDKYFIKYVVTNKNFQEYIHNFANGTTIKNVSLNTMREYPFLLPPLHEQQAIATILSSLDDKIDLLHRQNKTLEALAETLFRQWFVEEADESWEEKILDELIYFNPSEKVDRSKEYTFYEMKCLSDNSMCIDEGIKRAVSSATNFRNEDTLLAKITPCLENGKTGFVMHLRANEIARGSTEFIVMRSKGKINPYFIYCLTRSSDFRESAILSMTGTSGRQRVQIDLLKNYTIPYDGVTIEEFGKLVKSYFEKIKNNQIQIRTLTQLRDTLLPKLMSGEVRVI